MTDKMMELKEIETDVEIQISDWETFGNNIENCSAAFKEFFDNSLHGILKSKVNYPTQIARFGWGL